MLHDNLRHTLTAAHGVVFGGELVVVFLALGLVTPLGGPRQVGQGHDGGLESVRTSGCEVTIRLGKSSGLVRKAGSPRLGMHAALGLNVCAEVGLHIIVHPLISCPAQVAVEHGVERVPGVAVLREHSVPEPRPLVQKHLAGGAEW